MCDLDALVSWFNAWDFGGKFALSGISFYGTGLFAEVKGVEMTMAENFWSLQESALEKFSSDYYLPRFVVVGDQPMPIFYLPENHGIKGTLIEGGEVDSNNVDFLSILDLLITVTALYEPQRVRNMFCGIDLNRTWSKCYHILKQAREGGDVDPLEFARHGWAFICAAVYLEGIDCANPLTQRLTTIGKVAIKPGTSLHASSEPMMRFFIENFVNGPMLYPSDIAGLDRALTRFATKLGPFLKSTFFPPVEKNIPASYLNDFLQNLEVCLEFPLHY